MHGGRGRSPFQKMAFLRRATSDDALDFYRVMVAGKRKEGEGGVRKIGETPTGDRGRPETKELTKASNASLNLPEVFSFLEPTTYLKLF